MKFKRMHLLLFAIVVTAGEAWSLGGFPTPVTESRIQEQVTFLDNQAFSGGDQAVAQRLSVTFGVSNDVLLQEKATAGVTWGDVFLAHTIVANTRTALTTTDLLQMRVSGLTWLQVARNVNLSTTRFSDAIQIETRLMRRTATGTEGALERQVEFLNNQGSQSGDQAIAARLGAQFGVSTDVLLQERTTTGASWGDIFLALTIAANSRTNITTDQILQLRASGSTWTQIARSLNFSQARLSQAVRLETRTLGTRGGSMDLGTEVASLNNAASAIGDQRTAQQLAARFQVSSTSLLAEKAQFQVDWSDIFLAQTISARSRTGVMADQLLSLRTSGQSWISIAQSVGFSSGRLMTAARQSGRSGLFVTQGTTTTTTTTSGSTSTSGTGRTSGSLSGSTTSATLSGAEQAVTAALNGTTSSTTRTSTTTSSGVSTMSGATCGTSTTSSTRHGGDSFTRVSSRSTRMNGGTTTRVSGGSTTRMNSGAMTRTNTGAMTRGSMMSARALSVRAGMRGAMMSSMHSQAALKATARIQRATMMRAAVRVGATAHK